VKGLLSLYKPGYATALVYMLQNTEYRAGPYLKWFWRTQNFDAVMYRRTLDRTRPAKLLLLALRTGMFLQFAVGAGLIVQWLWQDLPGGWQFGVALILLNPIIWAHLVAVPLALGRWLIIKPRHRRAVKRSEKLFANHKAVRVAIVGSYGKTSMKELLKTVLSEGKKVAATPANKNVAISHARFARALDGDEDVLIIEYGEGQPGDVAGFAKVTHPTHAVVTGLAPAHLDRYKTLERAGKDIFSISQFVESKHVYVYADSPDAKPFIDKHTNTYDAHGALGWKVSHVKIMPAGTSFTLAKGKRKLKLTSGLLGRHNIGPLAFAAAFALELGLTDEQVIAGIARTAPFEHRMQPLFVNGALIIDDTYNGNLEGIRAGTALLHELHATRKWYVTPGLVDQGRATAKIHHEMGRLIAAAKPDVVVLMDNSVAEYIQAGLHVADFKGQIRIEKNPLEFYTTLPHFIAAGDIVLMQNDWTDNYA
jgi:UDP-N-acetylmuramoyl-tripeptide--D-alanyl-D-alanine ligase